MSLIPTDLHLPILCLGVSFLAGVIVGSTHAKAAMKKELALKTHKGT